ncbi:MAG: GntR family transcriptional regulator, partial [Oscillospiraceae bacterium]
MKTEGNLKESIYNAILEGIFNCEYKANQILNEKELTIRYNCSKSPVREALVTLCNENVLRNIPRYGYEVVRLTAEDVEDMLHFRFLLEGGMLKSNFLSFNAFQLEKLRALDESCCNEENDVWRHWESNVDFHLQMIAFSQNDCAYT